MIRYLLCLIVLGGLSLAACQQLSSGTGTELATVSKPVPISDAQQPAAPCPAQRPEVCVPEYLPVCGFIRPPGCRSGDCSDWQNHTYANGCSACTDQRVIGFSDGVCPEDSQRQPLTTDADTVSS